MNPSYSQRAFDFPAKDREGWLKAVQFPKGLGARPEDIASVLNQIVRYANKPDGHFENEESIAAYCKMSVRKVQRCLAALKRFDIITIERKYHHNIDKTLNHRRIAWDHLRILVEQQATECSEGHQCDLPSVVDRPAISRGATCHTEPTDLPSEGGRPDIQVADNRTGLKETTTNADDEWNQVVVVLSGKEFGMANAKDAIDSARQHDATLQEVYADIEAWKSLPLDDPKRLTGTLYRWIKLRSRPNTIIKRSPIRLPDIRQLRDRHRCDMFRENRSRWTDAANAEIEAEIDRRMKPRALESVA